MRHCKPDKTDEMQSYQIGAGSVFLLALLIFSNGQSTRQNRLKCAMNSLFDP